MTGHAAVGAVIVVARLRAVALAAQLHRGGHGDGGAIGAAQRRLIAGQVARATAQRAMGEHQALMELGKLASS